MTGFEGLREVLLRRGWPLDPEAWCEPLRVSRFRLSSSPMRDDLQVARVALGAGFPWCALLVDFGPRRLDRWALRGLAYPFVHARARSSEGDAAFPLPRVLVLVRDAEGLWAAHQEGETAMGSRLAVVPAHEAPLDWDGREEWGERWRRAPHGRRDRRQDRRRFSDRLYRQQSEALADLVALVKGKPRLGLAESRLAMEQMACGSEAARERLFWSMAEPAVALATRFWRRHPEVGAPLEDVVMPVLATLWAKLGEADETRGHDPRYLWTWVHRTLTRSLLEERRPLSVPAHVEDLYARQRPWFAAGREGELEPRLDLRAGRFMWAMEQGEAWGEVDDHTPAGTDPYAAVEAGLWVRQVLRAALERTDAPRAERFTPRHGAVLALRYGLHPPSGGEPLPMEEVGRILGISRERVRQLEGGALRRLRAFVEGGAEGSPVGKEPLPEALRDYVEAARREEPRSIEVRALLAAFGAKGRGFNVVASINARLEGMALACSPPMDHPNISLGHSVAIVARQGEGPGR